MDNLDVVTIAHRPQRRRDLILFAYNKLELLEIVEQHDHKSKFECKLEKDNLRLNLAEAEALRDQLDIFLQTMGEKHDTDTVDQSTVQEASPFVSKAAEILGSKGIPLASAVPVRSFYVG